MFSKQLRYICYLGSNYLLSCFAMHYLYNKLTRGKDESGPFVLAHLNNLSCVLKDRNQPVLRRFELRSRTALMDEQSNPYNLLQL